MLTGRSILHVNQDMGRCFVPNELKGYFNNLTEKVTKAPELLNTDELPRMPSEKGLIEFPVGIFQYGLGSYDLYLLTNEEVYKNKFIQCADWALIKQTKEGAWKNFSYIYPDHPYGAMCQGEGCSLLLRAYSITQEEKYFVAAKRAIDFMLLSVSEGGTTKYCSEDIYLLEYTHLPVVLNGWVFALFGLYDMCQIAKESKYTDALEKTIKTLGDRLTDFDCGYWSKYNTEKAVASPFYHSLHIAQLEALYLITNDNKFLTQRDRFMRFKKSKLCYFKAFIVKAFQKIRE